MKNETKRKRYFHETFFKGTSIWSDLTHTQAFSDNLTETFQDLLVFENIIFDNITHNRGCHTIKAQR